MTEVISVKFKDRGKTYFFDPSGISVPNDTEVVVETSKGLELGQCTYGNHYVVDTSVVQPLLPLVRIATEGDLHIAEINKSREKEAFEVCQQKIAEHGLDMKLVDVECNFEGNKTLFFFTSDGRVDFRELVKDLASIFRNRIELRQIGVRDEAKMLGGLGICGRPFCCNQFLDEFQPVSTKMAKTQSMSLNPAKISGNCGRLMCCLRYEEEAYEDLVKTTPKNGAFVETPAGYGSVSQVNLLRQTVKVRLDGDGDDMVKAYKAGEVAVVPGGRPKPGEKPPEILKYRPVPELVEEEEEVEEPDFWKAPSLLVSDFAPTTSAQAQSGEPEGRPNNNNNNSSNSRRRNNRGGRGGGKNAQQSGQKPRQEQKPKQEQKPRSDQQRKARPSDQKPRNDQRKQEAKPAEGAPAAQKPKNRGHRPGYGNNNRPRTEPRPSPNKPEGT